MNGIGSKMGLYIWMTFIVSGCGYTTGYTQRSLPGSYEKLAVPIFENKTQEVGVESYFTNALRRAFSRSRIAKLVKESEAPVYIGGKILSISYIAGGQVQGNDLEANQIQLPTNAVLTTEYRILVVTKISLIRTSDQKAIWQTDVSHEKVYSAPQVGLDVVNSANPLYNHSVRHQLLSDIANDMMSEAHEQMTENF